MKLPMLALVAFAAAAGADQTFRVKVDAVRVDVLVIDGKNPVSGLIADDFELRDNGVVQQIDSLAVEDVPLSVMLALDTSNSVKGVPLLHLKEAATAVVGLLAPRDRAALLTFDSSMNLRPAWTSDHGTLNAAIAATDAGGWTTLYDTSYAALTLRDPEPGRTLLLLFSDGADTASWLPGASVLDVARRNESVVYAVSLEPEGFVERRENTPIGMAYPQNEREVSGYRLDFRSGIQDRIPNAPTVVLLEPFLNALAAETGGKVFNAERSDCARPSFESSASSAAANS